MNLLLTAEQEGPVLRKRGVRRNCSLQNTHSSSCLMAVAAGRLDFHLQAHILGHRRLCLISLRRIYALDVGHDIAVGRPGFVWLLASLHHHIA